MSNINVKRQLVNPILNALAKDVKNDRKSLEKQLGQIFIFEPDKIRSLIKDLAAQYELKEPTSSDVKSIIDKVRSTISAREAAFMKVYGSNKVNKIKSGITHQLKPGDSMFVVRSFGTISRIKSGLLVAQIRQAFNRSNSSSSAAIGSQKFKFGVTGFGGTSGLHVGHGELGTPVAGLAVGRSVAKLDKLIKNSNSTRSKARLEELKSTITTQINDTLNVDIPYDILVTKDGKFRRTFAPILSFQDAAENLSDSVSDKRIKAIVEKTMLSVNQADFEGSTTIREAVEETTLFNIAGKHKSKGRKRPIVKEQGRSKAKKQVKTVIKPKALRTNFYSKALEDGIQKPEGGINPLALIAILNSKLQSRIVANMGQPGLTNKTGRFASSVKIVDIQFTNKGFPSIGYTYDHSPYQIFEVGKGKAPWASAARDPRKLIDMSIRQAAAEVMIGRFYTRRL